MGITGKRLLNLDDYPDVSYFKPKEGKNIIDIIPWIIQTNNHPAGMSAGLEDYILDIWVHYNVGAMESRYVCLERTFGKPCPICEEMKALKEDENATEKQINDLKPKHRAVYNLIDLSNENKGIQLFNVSHWNFEKELVEEAETAEEEIIVFSDLKVGRSIRFRANEVQRGGFKPYFEYKSFSFLERDEYDSDILNEAIPLYKILHIPTYEEVKADFLNISTNEMEEEEEKKEEVEEKITNNRKKRNTTSNREDNEDVPFDADKNEEEVDGEEVEVDEDEEVDMINNMNKKELRKHIKDNNLNIKITKEMSKDDIISLIKNTNKKEKSDSNECPHGHIFGEDLDDYDECYTCKKYDECSEAF